LPDIANQTPIVQNLGLAPVLVTNPVMHKVANVADMLSAVRQSLYPDAPVPVVVQPEPINEYTDNFTYWTLGFPHLFLLPGGLQPGTVMDADLREHCLLQYNGR